MTKSGFIYIWRDNSTNMYYVGSHIGTIADGYIGSGKYFKSAYNKRSSSFKRRIIEQIEDISQIKVRENYWLSMIKPEELGYRYYNLKKVSAGGNIVSNLSEEKKKEHSRKSGLASRKFWDNISPEEYKIRQERASLISSKVTDKNYRYRIQHSGKKATIITPLGEKIIVDNIYKYCKTLKLNYGNMKNMLSGKSKRKKCSGYGGSYV